MAELGHHRHRPSHWSWPAQVEGTVNIYSLAACRLFPDRTAEHGTPAEWRKAQQHLAAGGAFDAADHFVRLAMFDGDAR
ncbi:M60 family metallopeptidase [Streptomyces sp. WELS2]|uniref:M60 family metallopeptidase n=1 Tax=Streptomyces sp. WELS2 TaxID=2749435 RepID=UPI0015F0561D|nr:M60 family metallopeptidase [Streptomyces sp. WELS2]